MTYRLRDTIVEVKWGCKAPPWFHNGDIQVHRHPPEFVEDNMWTQIKGENIGIRRSEGYKKRKHKTKDVINDKLTTISLLKRGTIRSLRKQLNIGVGSVHREVKDGSIRRVVNYLKPTLNEKQKAAFINYICQFINLPSSQFVSFNHYIHLDKKCFYVK